MSAFTPTSFYHDLSAEARYEILATSWGLLTKSSSQEGGYNSSSSNPSHTMSRSKSYKLDLSSLAASTGMPLSRLSRKNNPAEPVSWGYFVDTVSNR